MKNSKIPLVSLGLVLLINAVACSEKSAPIVDDSNPESQGDSKGESSFAVLNGAGATFPYPVYAKWTHAYYNKTGTKLNYQSIGSV